ncbi:MAG TPA: hypothetical protein VIY30_00350, partial [Burkholderiaceae bacterium]
MNAALDSDATATRQADVSPLAMLAAAAALQDASRRAPVSRLEVSGLKKAFGSRQVVNDVHLAVGAGEVVGLLGPNGSG